MARGSRKGERRGGRKAGTPNRRTVELAERLQQLGCDPIEGMARLAMNEELSPELRGRMYAELAQYVFPKRRAAELSGPGGEPLQTTEHAHIKVYIPDNQRRNDHSSSIAGRGSMAVGATRGWIPCEDNRRKTSPSVGPGSESDVNRP